MTSPKIKRPEENSGGAGLEEDVIRQHVSVAEQIQSDPAAAAHQLSYFQRAAWLFTESLQARVSLTGDPDFAIQSANNAINAAHQAKQQGFLQEAAALYITGARLHFRSHSIVHILQRTSYSGSELKGILLQAFEGLGMIRELPEDDLEYWQDRLAEVAAALFGHVAAFDFRGKEQVRAALSIFYVAQVCKNLLPYRADADLTPLRTATFDPGGKERIHASIAHLEFLGKFGDSAMTRIGSILAHPIPGLDDLIYSLHVGIAIARKLERFDRHAEWIEQIHRIVDEFRDEHRSFDGRLFVVHQLANEFQFSLQSWAMDDLHNGSDLLAVAEMLKSRNLLDELGGCGLAPSCPAGWSDEETNDEKPDIRDPSPLHDVMTELVTHGLTRDEFRQVAMISYWPVFDAGLSSRLNVRDDRRYREHLETQNKLLTAEEDVLAKYGGFENSVRPAKPTKILNALQDDELLIEFFIPRDPFSPNRYCWVVVAARSGVACRGLYIESPPELAGQGQVHVIDKVMIERGPLLELTARIRAEILNRNDDEARQLLNRLFNSLLGTIINAGFEPEKFRRWILVPHGPLHLVPLHALVDNQGRHLIERVQITTAPSASVWLRMLRQVADPVERLVAVGNPSLVKDLPQLREAQDEVNQIPDHAPWLSSTCVMTGPGATESLVRKEMTNADILHFASHTEFDWRNPRDAHRILLTSDEKHDGSLLASEVRTMNLSNIRLVVLNTCSGAVCRYGPGDEPLGLLSAFISSGAENILGALWELRDSEAKRFVLEFYDALGEGDPGVALQAAACAAIRDEHAIADWAGLQLVGAARPFRSV